LYKLLYTSNTPLFVDESEYKYGLQFWERLKRFSKCKTALRRRKNNKTLNKRKSVRRFTGMNDKAAKITIKKTKSNLKITEGIQAYEDDEADN
jgi:hypothetical protein